MRKYDYKHILTDQDGSYTVKGYDTYPDNSVLAGQTRISFIDSFNTIEAAQEAYPDATLSNKFMEPMNSFNHLSDDGDY